MQEHLNCFLTEEKPYRLMLMALAKLPYKSRFNFQHCKDACFKAAQKVNRPVLCLVVSGKGIELHTAMGESGGWKKKNQQQVHEALEFIDQARISSSGQCN